MLLTRASVWRFRSFGTCIRVALVAGAASCASPASAQPRHAVKPAGPNPTGILSPAGAMPVNGFRQARFGMSEPELIEAIRRDFPAAVARLTRFTHPRERTTVLAVTAEELLPGAEPARIFYILGYACRRLIQVNIVWSGDGRGATRDEAIVAVANTLRDHFEAQYPAPLNTVVANQPIGDDAILVFRALQADGRMILLLLSRVASTGRPTRTLTTPPFTLRLAHIHDHRNPDIFRIEPGRF